MLLAGGAVVLVWCVGEFFRRGRGTLAPWDPPRRLVTSGLYRFSRNPMYVGLLLVLFGWAVVGLSPLVGAYAATMAVVFHLRVVSYEEPRLREQFPAEWAAYSARVPRWVGYRAP